MAVAVIMVPKFMRDENLQKVFIEAETDSKDKVDSKESGAKSSETNTHHTTTQSSRLTKDLVVKFEPHVELV